MLIPIIIWVSFFFSYHDNASLLLAIIFVVLYALLKVRSCIFVFYLSICMSICLSVCLSVCLSIHIFLIQDIITVYAKNQQVLRKLGPKKSLSTTKSQTVYGNLTELLMASTESPLYWTLLIFCSNTLALHCYIAIENRDLQ